MSSRQTTCGKDTQEMDADDPAALDTLLSVTAAAAALGLRPATMKQYILTERLAGVRVPWGHRVRLCVPRADIARYRRDSLGGKVWDKRKDSLARATGEDTITGDADEDEKAMH
jgi:hypothetical protein